MHTVELFSIFFFFNDTATTEIYTLSLHDALPISSLPTGGPLQTASPRRSTNAPTNTPPGSAPTARGRCLDRKSTRLNSSHTVISYAVFCLKKKKNSIKLRSNHHSSTM